MTTSHTVAIVGAGLAGATAAIALRDEGFEDRIVLYGDERHAPYTRPPLSKGYLTGETPPERLLVEPVAGYAEREIELVTGTRVVAVDVGARRLATQTGRPLAWDRLLVATGSAPRRLDVPGAGRAGVHHLRTRDDADAIAASARGAGRAVVVGGGWIGTEVAASLRQLGQEVTLVTPAAVPLQSVLGPEVGAVVRDIHAQHGVHVAAGRRVVEIDGDRRVRAVRLDDGSVQPADLVVVGIGVSPRLDLAREAGLPLEAGGIAVDECLEARPGVFAAGDVAAAWHPLLAQRVHIEHFDNAKRQGAAAARNLIGRREAYARMPSFFSTQFGLTLGYVGHARSWDEVVLRGDPASGRFLAFWLAEGRPVAALAANRQDAMAALRELVTRRDPVAAERLADPDVPLEAVARALEPVA